MSHILIFFQAEIVLPRGNEDQPELVILGCSRGTSEHRDAFGGREGKESDQNMQNGIILCGLERTGLNLVLCY